MPDHEHRSEHIGGTARVLSALPFTKRVAADWHILEAIVPRYGPVGQLESPEPARVPTDTKTLGAVANLGAFPLASEDDLAR